MIIDYITNIICLNCFEEKGIFHDSKNDWLQQKGETFCYVEKINRYKIIEYNLSQRSQAKETFEIFASNSIFSQILKAIETDWHNIFDHLNFDILLNFEKTVENVKIIFSTSASVLTIIQCEICTFIKTHNLIFRKFDHDESTNTFFEKAEFDLISQFSDYNNDN